MRPGDAAKVLGTPRPASLPEAATLLAAAILRLHQRAALAAKECPKSPDSSLAVSLGIGLSGDTGVNRERTFSEAKDAQNTR
jgi:hypothetical protein